MTAIVLGPADALVQALTDAVGEVPVIDADAPVDDTMWEALVALQGAHASMATAGGRIVVVLPTIGLAGAVGQVDYTTAVEGIRAMAKSARRTRTARGAGIKPCSRAARTPVARRSNSTATASPRT